MLGCSYINNPYSALDVAHYCICYCSSIGSPISNLQLKKLLYYVQAKFLVDQAGPCFSSDIVAWKYGPVVEDAFYMFRKYVDMQLTIGSDITSTVSDTDKERIKEVCSAKCRHSAGALVNMTREEEPWQNTKRGLPISLDAIREYFESNPGRLCL